MSSGSEIDAKWAEFIGRAARVVRGAEPTRTQRLQSMCNDVFRLEFARGPAAIIKIYSRGHGADTNRSGDRMLKELAALRLLTARGVSAPLVEADDAEAQTPWLMMTCAGPHAAGSTVGLTPAEARTVYRRCGELLAMVHGIGDDARAEVPSLPTYDPAPAEAPPPVDPGFRWALEKVAKEGRVTPAQLARIRQAATRPPPKAVLCHGDFHPNQCVRDGPRVTAITDWEGASFSDPIADYAKLAGYLAVGFDPDLSRETLAGYAAVRTPPDENDPHYRALRALQALALQPTGGPQNARHRKWREIADTFLGDENGGFQ